MVNVIKATFPKARLDTDCFKCPATLVSCLHTSSNDNKSDLTSGLTQTHKFISFPPSRTFLSAKVKQTLAQTSHN